jgi:hypothetical protein
MRLLVLIFAWTALSAQEASENEFQANFNTYTDNFKVTIPYPSASLTKKAGPSTRINGRYLVDAITAASMRSRFQVDGITSATNRSGSGQSVDGITGASGFKSGSFLFARDSHHPHTGFTSSAYGTNRASKDERKWNGLDLSEQLERE